MDIVLITDNNYVMPTGVLMTSVLANNQCQITFHIVSGEAICDSNKKNFAKTVTDHDAEVRYYLIDPSVNSLLPMGLSGQSQYISIATYYRLFLTDILPETCEKVIYIDGDIICRHSLEPLWNMDITEHPMGAVRDIANNFNSMFERLNYSKVDGYYNAGVLLINLKWWREHKVKDMFIDYIAHNRQVLKCHDQDVLNYNFRGEILDLPLKYNVQNNFYFEDNTYRPCSDDAFYGALKDPVLVHYCTNIKPWYKGCPHPFAKDFVSFLRKSEWRNYLMRVYPANTIKGKISNILVLCGLKKYNNRYIDLSRI